MMVRRTFGRIVSALFVMSVPGIASASSVLYNYNVVTLGNFTENSHVNFNTFVGGDLYGGSNSVFSMTSGSSNPVGLTIAGVNRAYDIKVNNGKNVVLTDAASNQGSIIRNGGGQIQYDSTLAQQKAAISSELASTSAAFKALASNQSAPVVTQNGQFTFTANKSTAVNGVAVFTLDGSKLSSQSIQNGISIAGDYLSSDIKGIIINVTGTSITHSQGNFNGAWNNDAVRTKTLWNFADATSLDLQKNFNGTILAYNANVTQGSTSIDSPVFAKTLVSNGEIHGPLYTGYVPNVATVPEPASVVMAFMGMAFVAGAARRRSLIGG
jgi:choice-of-anchor A domain-containing protein